MELMMFYEDDDGSLFFEASTLDDKHAEISIEQLDDGDWIACISFSDAGCIQVCDANRDVLAASAINQLHEMLGTEHNRLRLFYPYRDLDDDWPMLQAMSHDDLQRALAVSEAEAAKRMSVSPSSLRRMRERGEGPPARRVGERRVVYLVSDINAWLATRPVAL